MQRLLLQRLGLALLPCRAPTLIRRVVSSLSSAAGRSEFQSSKQAKVKLHWVCDSCGQSFHQWWGECKSCHSVNTLKQFREPSSASAGAGGGAAVRAIDRLSPPITRKLQEQSYTAQPHGWLQFKDSGPQRVRDILNGGSPQLQRLPLPGGTGEEVSRVLGGGLVHGSLLLVGGDPGVGKSTLLLQVAGLLAEGSDSTGPAPVLYVSGEESVEQISGRADRLNVMADDLFLYSATDLELVLKAIQDLSPRAVIIDSIQTMYLPEATGSSGSVSQVRECASALLRFAKQSHIPIFLVGHVTKSGDIAGPRVLEHIVDVVLYMEGERLQSHRLLRAVKNRYGSTDEVGVFEMIKGGLVAVPNPSELFLSDRAVDSNHAASAAVAVTMEGSRPLLLEVQALCSSVAQAGRRTANGVDSQRLFLLLAVLAKQAGLSLANQDVFINVVGGLQLREPAADVAIAVAVASSYLEKPFPRDMAFIGEIGLGGELRAVGQLERRLVEAGKMGFRSCVIPKCAGKSVMDSGLNVVPCSDIKEVIERVWPLCSERP